MKDIEKQLKVEQLSREETSGKYDNAFMEVKETIEAIQWILTETMRITSDQQILSKRQQIRMKNAITLNNFFIIIDNRRRKI